MKLLHIDSSITGDHSVSRAVSGAVVNQIKSANPGVDVSYLDLASNPLPHVTLPDIGDPTSNTALNAFLAADIIVIGAGMYNFTVPSQLKAWIDRILIAGQTFKYTETGPQSLVAGKRAIAVLSRGGLYGPGAPAEAHEHAESYLRSVFAFLAIPLELIVAEGVAMGDDVRKAAMAAAFARAQAIAA